PTVPPPPVPPIPPPVPAIPPPRPPVPPRPPIAPPAPPASAPPPPSVPSTPASASGKEVRIAVKQPAANMSDAATSASSREEPRQETSRRILFSPRSTAPFRRADDFVASAEGESSTACPGGAGRRGRGPSRSRPFRFRDQTRRASGGSRRRTRCW